LKILLRRFHAWDVNFFHFLVRSYASYHSLRSRINFIVFIKVPTEIFDKIHFWPKISIFTKLQNTFLIAFRCKWFEIYLFFVDNFVFWWTFWFLTIFFLFLSKIFIFVEKFDCCRKFRFLSKNCIFIKNFGLKFLFLFENSYFYRKFFVCWQFLFLLKIPIFVEIFDFWGNFFSSTYCASGFIHFRTRWRNRPLLNDGWTFRRLLFSVKRDLQSARPSQHHLDIARLFWQNEPFFAKYLYRV